jgi:hypothetical protein
MDTTINIEENNKLIAEFMGIYPLNIKNYSAMICTNNGYYHKSWDWLMPVFKKIGDYMFSFEWDSKEHEKFDEIFPDTIVLHEIFDGDIESIFLRVVEFIKWYNQNKEI